MTTDPNPADAVREAHVSLTRIKASRLSIQHADDLLAIEDGIDALHNRIADLTTELAKAKHDRLAALAGAAPVAWMITSPDAELSTVTMDPERAARYADYATPLFTHAPAKAREDGSDELKALRVQEWMHREFNELASVQDIEKAMRTPCSCPFTEDALATFAEGAE